MFYKVLLNIVLLLSCLIIFYVVHTSNNESTAFQIKQTYIPNFSPSMTNNNLSETSKEATNVIDQYFNVWCIFTKVKSKTSSLKFKFNTLITSILHHSSVKLSFHIITDPKSQYFAQLIFSNIRNTSIRNVDFTVQFYNVHNITLQLSELTKTMLPYFSSQPGSYYSDALFFISLGLHKIAPRTQSRAIMLDVDTKLLEDIALLFQEFSRFEEREVVGIAPEMSPVYQHILFTYRSQHKNSHFGSPLSLGGFPGVNSGVLLLHLDRLRNSIEYNQLLTPSEVERLAKKYNFKGHLGDQDWYTLVGMERRHLLHLLSCSWNRQLCEWWRDHGYRDTFDSFAQCSEPTRIYHGNCNTPIPRD